MSADADLSRRDACGDFLRVAAEHFEAAEQRLVCRVRTGFRDEFEREIRGDVHIAKLRHECALRAADFHDGIKSETIDKAATFLIGKCSCEVKEQTPGFDLLLAADWKALLTAQNAGIPDLPTMAELTKSAPVCVPISSNASPAKVDPEKAALRDRTFVIVAALAVAALIAALLLQGSDCL